MMKGLYLSSFNFSSNSRYIKHPAVLFDLVFYSFYYRSYYETEKPIFAFIVLVISGCEQPTGKSKEEPLPPEPPPVSIILTELRIVSPPTLTFYTRERPLPLAELEVEECTAMRQAGFRKHGNIAHQRGGEGRGI
jgi:hypothetical protein